MSTSDPRLSVLASALSVSDDTKDAARKEAIREYQNALGDLIEDLTKDPDDADGTLTTDEIRTLTARVKRLASGASATSDTDANLQRKLSEAEAEAQKQKDRISRLETEKKTLQQQLNDSVAGIGNGNILVLRKDDDPANAGAILDLNRDEKGNLHPAGDVRKLYEEKGHKVQLPGKPPVYYPVAPPNGDDTNGNGGTTPPAPDNPTDTTSGGTRKSRRARVWNAIVH